MSLLLQRKILLVDDEPAIGEALRRYFSRRGFEILVAHSGEEALKTLESFHPNLVLLDLLMPGLDGLETLRRMRLLSPETKVVVASAVRDDRILEECRRLGALDYVVKPFDLGTLHARVFGKLLG